MLTETATVIRDFWRCPNCQAKLGERIGGRLVMVIRGETVQVRAPHGLERTCPRCGHAARYPAQRVIR
jgi:hypothetical protein